MLSACALNTAQVKSALLSNVDVLPSFTGVVSSNGRAQRRQSRPKLRRRLSTPSVSLNPVRLKERCIPRRQRCRWRRPRQHPWECSRVEFYQGTVADRDVDDESIYGDVERRGGQLHAVTAKAYTLGQSATSAAVHITVNPASGSGTSATFVSTDTTTQGSWKGVKGTRCGCDRERRDQSAGVCDGGDRRSGDRHWSAATTTCARCKRAAAADRIAVATWYSASAFSIDVNIDRWRCASSERVCGGLGQPGPGADARGARRGHECAALDTRSVSAFAEGRYYAWSIRGHVISGGQLTVASTLSSTAACLSRQSRLGGVARSATFVVDGYDDAGQLEAAKGADGFAIANDATSLPAYATATP